MSQRVEAGEVFSAEELTRDRGCGAQAPVELGCGSLQVGHSAADSGMGSPEVGFNSGPPSPIGALPAVQRPV